MNPNDQVRIEAYLLGEMPSEEVEAFETQIANDPELRDAVELERDVHALFRYHRKQELREHLRTLGSGTRKNIQSVVVWCAALAAVVAFAVYFGVIYEPGYVLEAQELWTGGTRGAFISACDAILSQADLERNAERSAYPRGEQLEIAVCLIEKARYSESFPTLRGLKETQDLIGRQAWYHLGFALAMGRDKPNALIELKGFIGAERTKPLLEFDWLSRAESLREQLE